MTRTKHRQLTLTGAASLFALSLATGSAYAQEKEFNIEAQPLAKALLDFNEQSGLTVAAPRELVADDGAHRAVGRLVGELHRPPGVAKALGQPRGLGALARAVQALEHDQLAAHSSEVSRVL